ncbi:MAG TPA: ROK family protein [Candidatus Acidoferrales bacterium]|nr:ROK family protein [Candidatus Acidoferrales bacterium]
MNNFQVATSETARDINSRIMLNLVRKHQPISRADLMRHSGLQRSTVSVITEQLIAERWLREGEVGQLPRGRRPTFLHLNEDRAGIFGINVRPFMTNMALANLEGRFLEQESMVTPSSPDEFVKQIAERVHSLMKERPQMAYEGIGVSLPGRVDLSSQKFIFAPNLKWHEEDLKERLESATGLPVDLENEANACALSEFWFGRHSDSVSNLIAVAVSEGIGVGMILNGQIVRGPSGLAGEFGHVSINENGPKCGCGNRGCWEVFASNSAGVRYYEEAKLSKRNGKTNHTNHKQPDITFEDVLQLAEQGDLQALDALDRMAHYLGRGIAMLVTGLAPDVIVVVGEVTRAWDRLGPIITDVVRQRSFTHPSTRIIASGPAPQPRLRGIIALVLQKHFGAPSIA